MCGRDQGRIEKSMASADSHLLQAGQKSLAPQSPSDKGPGDARLWRSPAPDACWRARPPPSTPVAQTRLVEPETRPRPMSRSGAAPSLFAPSDYQRCAWWTVDLSRGSALSSTTHYPRSRSLRLVLPDARAGCSVLSCPTLNGPSHPSPVALGACTPSACARRLQCAWQSRLWVAGWGWDLAL